MGSNRNSQVAKMKQSNERGQQHGLEQIVVGLNLISCEGLKVRHGNIGVSC